MRNQILATPPIMTFFYLSLKNETAKGMSGNTKPVGLIGYTLRFHFDAASEHANLATIHGAFTVQYWFSFTKQYTVN